MYELFHEIGLNKKEIEEILQSKKYHRIRKSHYTSLNKPTDREREIMKLLYEKYKLPFYKIGMAFGCADNLIPKYCPLIKNRGHCVGKDSQINIFERVDTKEKAYLIGLLVADGSVQREGYCISISLQEEDKAILEILSELFGGRIMVTHKKQVEDNKRKSVLYRLYWNSQKCFSDIIELGINPRKSKEGLANIPIMPDKLISHFIRGYWDGDGLSFQTQRIGFCGDLKVLSFIKEYLITRGMSNNKICYNKSNHIYYLQWTKKEDVVLLLKIMFQDCNNLFIPRKINKYRPLFKELDKRTQNMLETPKAFDTKE